MTAPFCLRLPSSLRLFTLLILAVIIAGSACSSGEGRGQRRDNSNSVEDQNPAIAITVAKTEARNIPAYIQATGSLIADETSDVAPKIAGKVANVSANVGQFVGQGAVIAKIDDSDQRRALVEA